MCLRVVCVGARCRCVRVCVVRGSCMRRCFCSVWGFGLYLYWDSAATRANFRPIHWSDLQCTVNPFVDDLGSSEAVEICTAGTAWDTADGETVILVFGQGLWFGERMPKSLINPNQCRAFGISLCDDPTDPHRALGMYDHENDLDIPMVMNGSFCSLLTRCPTKDEIQTCLRRRNHVAHGFWPRW